MEESKTNDVDVIKRSMSDEAFDEAVKLTRSALESQEVDKDVAEHIKTQMEKKFHGSWYVFFYSFSIRISRFCRIFISSLLYYNLIRTFFYILIELTISYYIRTGIVSSEKISAVRWSSIRRRCAHTRSQTKACFCFEVRKLIEFVKYVI